MPIQFHCPGCSQPIEVDDIHAGQTAACPYCRRVVSVPDESALDRSHPAAARPTIGGANGDTAPSPGLPDYRDAGAGAAPPPPPMPGALHVGPSLGPRERVARTFGNYALVCTCLALLLFGAAFAYGLSQMMSDMLANPGSQPSPERMAELSEGPWMLAANIGMLFFALVGVALAITSLTQSRKSNWRAIVSLVISGLFVLCACGGTVMAVATGGFAPPA